MTARRWGVAILAGAALLLLLGRAIAGVYVDYHWYAALGATSLWWARWSNLAMLRIGYGLVGTLFLFANLYAVRQSVVSLVLPRRVANLEIGEEVPGHYLVIVAALIAIVVGILLAIPQRDWVQLAGVRWGLPFGETDPHFEADLGYFVWWLPFEQSMQVWALIALLVATTLVVFLYALTPSLRWERGTLHVSGYVRRHLTVLGALLLLLLAWSYRLDAYGLLNHGSGPGGVFTSFDHRPGIPVNLMLAFATATLAVLVLWAGWTGQMRIAFIAVTLVLVMSLGLRQLLPTLSRRMAGPTDPESREQGYVTTRALHTRRAYNVDRLVLDDAPNGFATARDASGAFSSWDVAAVERSVERVRPGRINGGVGWAADTGSGALVAVAVQRPTGPDAIDPFTPWHLIRSAAAGAVDDGTLGGVDRAIGGLERAGVVDAPLVFDSAAGYLIVPERTGDVAAAPLSSFGSLLAHAWDQQDLRLLANETESQQARMLLHRDVRERVGRLAPFFRQGTTFSPVMRRDSLYWVVHLYAASSSYPLSERLNVGDGDVSYFYHAATALVDARTGNVRLVADSVQDPIATTWTRRFPRLFTSWSEIPVDLAAQVPPPLDGALAIAHAFARVGARGDLSPSAHLPREIGGDTLFSTLRWPPFVSPGTGRLAWSAPLLDAADRVRGVISAGGGPQWTVHWQALDEPGPRWASVIDRLQRVPDVPGLVSRDIPLKRGPVRVLPLQRGMAFAQSTYAWRGDGPPVLTRVAVLEGDSVRTGATFAEAVGDRDGARSAPVGTPAEFRARVELLYRTMRDAMTRGDWSAFGAAWAELGSLVRVPPS
ncbi:MAG TPA: UPF0182 family protein [Gemmatimonadaceae bacterium]|nr:UPF0182 family protein [Gemmatimonadaceae bacterium]